MSFDWRRVWVNVRTVTVQPMLRNMGRTLRGPYNFPDKPQELLFFDTRKDTYYSVTLQGPFRASSLKTDVPE